MHYFHNLSSASGGLVFHRGSIPGPRWGTSVPISLVCPPLEKIMRAPMYGFTKAWHQSSQTETTGDDRANGQRSVHTSS